MIMSFLMVTSLAGAGDAAPSNTNAVIVGVLDRRQCDGSAPTVIRPLFLKRGHDWIALTSEEASKGLSFNSVNWTVTLDGRILGSVTGVDPGIQTDGGWTISRDRLLPVAVGQSVPSVGNKDGRFEGWCGAPAVRPLVVVSAPAGRDPDAWKPFRPPDKLRERLMTEFKARTGAATTCPSDSETPKPLNYSVNDLVFSNSYKDRSGRKLVSVSLDPHLNTCDGPADPPWEPQVFLLNESLQYLGSSLSLVDAGDYDSDGASEAVFWFSGYNEDGYTLFYNGFQNRVDFRWTYH